MKTKNQRYTTTMRPLIQLFALALVLSACSQPSGSEDLDKLKMTRDSLKSMRTELTDELNALEAKIDALDTNKLLRVTNVTTLEVNTSRFEHFFTVQGSVETDQNALLFPEALGKVTAIWVAEGKKVTKGSAMILPTVIRGFNEANGS